MVFSLVAWSQSVDPGAAYVNLNGVQDEITVVSNKIVYVPPTTTQLVGAMACIGATAPVGAYLQSPSLRAVALYDISPCVNAVKPVTGAELSLHASNPLPLAAGEGLEAYVNSDPASAEQYSVVAILSDGPLAPVAGEIYHVRFTTNIAETAGQWKNGPITLGQTLPVGTYQVVGAKMWGTSGVAFRFVPKGAAERPGAPCVSAIQYDGNSAFRHGGLGVWFEFHSLTPPSVDWLASATSGTVQYGILDLIKTA